MYRYAYLPNGVRSAMTIASGNNSALRRTEWTYDLNGRLSEIKDGDKTVSYKYNNKNQLIEQVIDGMKVTFTYTKLGQLAGKVLGDNLASLKYEYDNDGMITARTVNGARQLYSYDAKGQLVKVAQNGQAVEEYVYDAAGNILKKTVEGKTTDFKYDAANQLVSAKLPDGTVKDFAYDAAGRMVKQGNKNYAYGWMNKVMSIAESGKVCANYDYQVDGQVSQRTGADGKTTDFLWDGLALIGKGNMTLTNEPYVTGGNPVIAGNKTLFNDILGTSQGSTDGKDFAAIKRDSFGEVLDNNVDTDYDYFTGKPNVEGLGYAFLFRSYNAGLGKWATSDPLGYPDGWNNFAYCNNRTTDCFDWLGGETTTVTLSLTDVSHNHNVDKNAGTISVSYSGQEPTMTFSVSQYPGYTYVATTLQVWGWLSVYRNDEILFSDWISYSWVYVNGAWVDSGYAGDSASQSISKSAATDKISIEVTFNVRVTVKAYDPDGREGLYYDDTKTKTYTYTIKE